MSFLNCGQITGLGTSHKDKRQLNFCARQEDPCVCLGVKSAVPCPAIEYANITGTLLITGGCGFVGSNTIMRLYEKCPDLFIVNLDNLSSTSAAETNIPTEIRNDSSRYAFVNGSIDDETAVGTIFSTYTVKYCIALAAWLPYEAQPYRDFALNNVSALQLFLAYCAPHCLTPLNPTGTLEHIIYQGSGMARFNAFHSGTTVVAESSQPHIVQLDAYTSTKTMAFQAAMYYAAAKDAQLPITICHPDYIFSSVNAPAPEYLRSFYDTLTAETPGQIQLNRGDRSVRTSFVHVDDVIDAYAIVLLEGCQHKIIRPANPHQIFSFYAIARKMVAAVKNISIRADMSEWIAFTDDMGVISDHISFDSRFAAIKNLGNCYNPVKTVDATIMEIVNAE